MQVVSRRSFLGMASLWAVIVSSAMLLAGLLRLTKPSVHYEESTRFKIGKPDNFPVGTVKELVDKNVFILSDSNGLHAISNVCTHLGCLVTTNQERFSMPLSRFQIRPRWKSDCRSGAA